MLTDSLIETILTTLPSKTVGVLGDLFLDRYLDLDAALTEPSIETGLDAYQVMRVRSYPGALGTVINNLAALGVGRIRPLSVIGDDGEGYELRSALQRLKVVDLDGVVAREDRRTPTYTKPMLHQAGRPPRELNRLDIKNRTPSGCDQDSLIKFTLGSMWAACDAWVVLDQVSEPECGVVTRSVRILLEHLAQRDPGMFVLADSRERIGEFRRVSVKPNWQELLKVLQDSENETGATPEEQLARTVGGTVFCTRGERDSVVVWPAPEGGRQTTTVPTYPVGDPVDPVGAGDSVSAGITCAMLGGATPPQAAAFGNLIASITVRQIGTTGSASPDQVRQRWRKVSGP
jgi:bifunctional ADP-heptose synthase (sugar kinase/adenylyltransferase)